MPLYESRLQERNLKIRVALCACFCPMRANQNRITPSNASRVPSHCAWDRVEQHQMVSSAVSSQGHARETRLRRTPRVEREFRNSPLLDNDMRLREDGTVATPMVNHDRINDISFLLRGRTLSGCRHKILVKRTDSTLVPRRKLSLPSSSWNQSAGRVTMPFADMAAAR